MQSLFLDTRILDAAAREQYGLTEELMMENAAAALERPIIHQILLCAENKTEQTVVILCGRGNNGADGYALARRLFGYLLASDIRIIPIVVPLFLPKSDLCILQVDRAKRCGVTFIAPDGAASQLLQADIIVDCIFGSGFYGDLDATSAAICSQVNTLSAVRLACDVPTGLRADGTVAEAAFCADCTVTMGALKLSLYSDAAKDIVGQIVCENLGVSRHVFESKESVAQLLQAEDICLPYREKNLVNKGSFGHAAIASGEKIGASCLAGAAALRFGAGLVTLVRRGTAFESSELPQVSPELMTATDFPANTTAVACGMGLGRNEENIQPYFDWLCAHQDVLCVLDADACYATHIATFLQQRAKGVVLTPHPKEFQVLLHNCGLGNYTISDCVHARPKYIEQFCRAFPQCVLLVKGSNPMIGTFSDNTYKLFVNPLGTAALAKAGSGDILAGLICALLAQGRTPLNAAINGSLAHALASRQFKNGYSLTPLALLDAVAQLQV